MTPIPRSLDELDELISQPPDWLVESLNQGEGDFIVLGAAGKMGFHLCRMLQRAIKRSGHNRSITTVSRFSSPSARNKFQQHGFDVVAADLSDEAQIANVPLAENVIYLAGMKFGTSTSPELLQRMNVQMPQLVADRFRDSRIVALSTGCVYSFTTPESGGSVETGETNPPGDYAQSCLGRERAFKDGSIRHPTRCALVRLNYSVDLTYGVLVDIAASVLAGRSVDLSTGYVNVIWQGDAIAHILGCFAHVSTPPFIVNVTGAETLSVRDLAERFAQRFDCPVSFRGHEAPTAWLSNSSLSHQMFGKPKKSVSEMIDSVAVWLQQGGETLGKPTHFQNREGNY